jgi:hypothetical protein
VSQKTHAGFLFARVLLPKLAPGQWRGGARHT